MASRQIKSGSGGNSAAVGSPTRHLEVETKLEIGADTELPDLTRSREVRQAGMTGVTDPVVHELDATYYDTDRLDLLNSKMTLRRRTGGDDAGWHLKLPAAADARTEVGLPLDSGPDYQVPAALSDLVAGAARGRSLQPVARIRNRRVVRRLTGTDGRELVEIADDHVDAVALLAPDAVPSQWRELEAELIDGSREQLAATVAGLRKAGATPASSASKLARALSGVTGSGGTPAEAKKQRDRKRDRSAGAAVTAALARLRDTLITADRSLRESTPDSVHDARAAARRIRSVLGVFGELFEPTALVPLRNALRDHGVVLSAARDLEVIEHRLTAQLVEEPAEYASAAAERLRQEFAQRTPAAMAAVGERIRSAEYFQMLRDLDEIVGAAPFSRRAAKPAATELPALLSAAWRDLRGHADQALADPDNLPEVHAVRKQAKAVRYSTEAAAAVLGEEAVVFAAAIEEIQVVLGEHQDAVASARLLAELATAPDTSGTAGFVFGRLHAFEQAVAHGTIDDFSDAWDRVEDGDLLEQLSLS